MSFDHSQLVGPGVSITLYLDRVDPEYAVFLKNMGGGPLTYRLATGDAPNRAADSVAPVTLTGTVTLANGSQMVIGAGTSFDTELVVGDVVSLADGKVLGVVDVFDGATPATKILLFDTWKGVSAAGLTLYKVTPANRPVLQPGEQRREIPPLSPTGAVVVPYRHYLFVQNRSSSMLQVGIYSPNNCAVTRVRMSSTELFVAP